eukprot:gene45548-60872_t
MGRTTRPARAAAWGAVAGTLPDLDVLIAQGDPILDMVLHRAESHAFFWLTLFSLPFAWAVARLHGETDRWRRWWAALWLALVTHPMLDLLTVYGTQVFQPFTDEAYGLGSIFIIDPAYTLPLLVGLAMAMCWPGQARGLAGNRWALGLSTAYLLWSALAQAWVLQHARVVVVDHLGAESAWAYGLQQLEKLAKRKGQQLAMFSGDLQEDEDLLARSTAPRAVSRQLWQYMRAGGAGNALQFLRAVAFHGLGHGEAPLPPRSLPQVALHVPR